MDINECLEKRFLIKTGSAPDLVQKELAEAAYDLEKSEKAFSDEDWKWAIIKAYYCMFHAARALLYSKGYREKSHFCLRAALKNLFVDNNLLELNFLDDYDMAKDLRENADYKSNFSKEGAQRLIEKAGGFLSKVKSLLK